MTHLDAIGVARSGESTTPTSGQSWHFSVPLTFSS